MGLEKLSYQMGELNPMCTPYLRQKSRGELDRCGDIKRDPYTSYFTWSSRNELASRGKVNIFSDPELRANLPRLQDHVEDLRRSATNLCCGPNELNCRAIMQRVNVSFCKPSSDPNSPDPCVFGGNFKMSGTGYATAFRQISRHYALGSEAHAVAVRNLTPAEAAGEDVGLESGSIVLSSYVPREQGFAAIDPTLLHEFGHACSMARMQVAAMSGSTAKVEPGHDVATRLASLDKTTERNQKAMRAVEWLDRARKRCDGGTALPEAYYDFFESIGENHGLAQCLYKLTADNQHQQVDKPCSNLCPGHFMEETVGIAFSLLLGNLDGGPGGVFPQTCDHVRDGQHPMVSDVMECLAQNSPRFRSRMRLANNCDAGSSALVLVSPALATTQRSAIH